jgi:hypothetical protein
MTQLSFDPFTAQSPNLLKTVSITSNNFKLSKQYTAILLSIVTINLILIHKF